MAAAIIMRDAVEEMSDQAANERERLELAS